MHMPSVLSSVTFLGSISGMLLFMSGATRFFIPVFPIPAFLIVSSCLLAIVELASSSFSTTTTTSTFTFSSRFFIRSIFTVFTTVISFSSFTVVIIPPFFNSFVIVSAMFVILSTLIARSLSVVVTFLAVTAVVSYVAIVIEIFVTSLATATIVVTVLVLSAIVRVLLIVVHYSFAFATPAHFRHGLGEINVNTAIVDQDVIHFKVGVLTALSISKLDERVLQGIAGLTISYHFATVRISMQLL